MTVGLTMTSNQDGHQGAKGAKQGEGDGEESCMDVQILNSQHVTQTGIHKEYKGSLQ